jgi:2-dehydro-3-deoxygluconokinase
VTDLPVEGSGATTVVCVGETMAVVAPTAQVSLADAEQCLLGIGGAESNVAAQLAELGLRAAWAGRVGADQFGTRILRTLAQRGVDVSRAETDPYAPTGVYFKEPDTGAGAATLYYRAGSAAARMDPGAVRRWELYSSDWVHVSGITAALSGTCRAFIEDLMLSRRLKGLPTSFDVNFRPALWGPEQAAPVLLALARRATLVLVGLDEAHALWGCTKAEDVAQLIPDAPTVVVKDGPTEAVEFARDARSRQSVHRVPAHRAEVVEPVGAGDAFAAGYLAGLIQGLDPEPRLNLGHALAAWTLGDHSDFRPGHGITIANSAIRR